MPKKRPESSPPQISAGDLPSPEMEISGFHFHIEFIDVPDWKERREQIIEHVGQWLLAEWDIQTNGLTESPDARSVDDPALGSKKQRLLL